ncbi:hypothetical protein CS022_19765 [Veronia nyctiphanis]|uniref:Uncharacterized protein n=1 Tax=Veronia nyctiphanis TaxID=1278244 RepID=A0A4Q0YPB5_9GAMM|nr:hypothetical protein CS022_19765 [Veronia nyctiphanis]
MSHHWSSCLTFPSAKFARAQYPVQLAVRPKPFGLGWRLSETAIIRKYRGALPTYKDGDEQDTFLFSGEELVPALVEQDNKWQRARQDVDGYRVDQFRPRHEGGWQRIERWQDLSTNDVFWRTITIGNVQLWYGYSAESRLSDPENPLRVFEWKLSHVVDDRGNLIRYRYKRENREEVSPLLSEKCRHTSNCTQLYLKRVWYGVKTPYKPSDSLPNIDGFLFETVFDYGEHDSQFPTPDEQESWSARANPFSDFRAGFDIRTYRLCERVLLFHRFDELPLSPCLVSATHLTYSSDESGISQLSDVVQKGHLWDEETRENVGSSQLYLPTACLEPRGKVRYR